MAEFFFLRVSKVNISREVFKYPDLGKAYPTPQDSDVPATDLPGPGTQGPSLEVLGEYSPRN